MNSIQQPNQYAFLVGCYDQYGEFWCYSEFKDTEEDKARAAYESLCTRSPKKHVELIQKITMYKVMEHYYPKHENV